MEEGETPVEAVPRIKYGTLEIYATAMVHLYDRQVQRKTNSNPHPLPTFAPLLQRVKREDEMTKKANFEDRGVGTIMDGYTTTDEIADVNKFNLGENSPKDLRNCLTFLLSLAW